MGELNICKLARNYPVPGTSDGGGDLHHLLARLADRIESLERDRGELLQMLESGRSTLRRYIDERDDAIRERDTLRLGLGHPLATLEGATAIAANRSAAAMKEDVR